MPRHFANSRSRGRWVAWSVMILSIALVATGVWWVASNGAQFSTETTGAPQQATQAPSNAATTENGVPAITTASSAAASPTQAPASEDPNTAQPTHPVSGWVDTLDGLVPDYVLPPIENGMVPVLTKVPTEQKVVFLTIDDGAIKRESDMALLEKNGVKASLFLAHNFVAGSSDFYRKYTAAGHLIENHTMTHNLDFIHLSYEQQKSEICKMADFEEEQFGRRPVFFRPPGGPYTMATRKAVAECGLKAIVDWETKANAGGMDYQVGAGLRPGDIVLMHFRQEFPDDLAAFLKAQKAAGLKVVLLEDYLATP